MIPFDEYIAGVLPHEWIPSWHDESLRAGSLAIRTYAWLELGVATLALVSLPLVEHLDHVVEPAYQQLGGGLAFDLARAALVLVILLLPTALMGASGALFTLSSQRECTP